MSKMPVMILICYAVLLVAYHVRERIRGVMPLYSTTKNGKGDLSDPVSWRIHLLPDHWSAAASGIYDCVVCKRHGNLLAVSGMGDKRYRMLD